MAEPNYCETAKKYLFNDPSQLIHLLLNFDKTAITEGQIWLLREKVLSQPDFNLNTVSHTSQATKYLYLWVVSMEQWYQKWSNTKPLRENLHDTKILLKNLGAKLKEKTAAGAQLNAVIRANET